MDQKLKKLLEDFSAGKEDFSVVAAAIAARTKNLTKIDGALLDHSRSERCGFPEFVYGAGKSADEICRIIPALRDRGHALLVTRVDPDKAAAILEKFPQLCYDEKSRALFEFAANRKKRPGKAAIVCAGTSDLAVAMEAKITIDICDYSTELFCDIGVASIERLFSVLEALRQCDCAIVIAGMEGALPSVVGGLLKAPVIAVPTSVGYGVSAGGFAALTGMLSSCASGVTVVNIDNGFGAACAAIRILNNRNPEGF